MAGNKRFAAILFVGLTLLAATGGGAYYMATSRGLTLALVPDAAADPQAMDAIRTRSAAPSANDLDAVAKAWAAPASSDERSIDNTRENPYSAKVSPPEVHDIAAVPAVDDRYGGYMVTPASAEAEYPESRNAMASAPAETGADPSAEPEVAMPVAMPVARESHESISDLPADGNDLVPIARGQEPRDEAEEMVAVADVVEESSEAPRELNEDTPNALKPLSLPADVPGEKPAAQRARAAFRDEPAATAQERYDSLRGAAANDNNAATRSNSMAVNPFASRSTSSIPSAATARAADASGLIETLPPASSGDGDISPRVPPRSTSSQPLPNEAFEPTGSDAPDEFDAAAKQLPSSPSAGALPPSSLSATGSNFSSNTSNDPASITGTGRPGEKGLEGPQQPTLLIQKFAPGEIQVGKPAKFVVQVRNAGSQTADEVVVRDEVPQGTRLVSTSPSAAVNGAQLVWQIGKLSAGEERSLEMQLMPIAEGEVGSVATVSYSAQASVKTRCTMPQLAVRMTAPDKVMIGEEQRVKIELRNPGSGDATGVMLFENVPENVRHSAGPALEFEIGTLRAGETRELELILTAEKAGKVVNVLTARAEGNLQVQQQVEFEVIAPALEVIVEGPERRYLERPATYEVSVENPGTAPAHDVQIITKLPKGMRFVRANNMGEYDAASHAVYWSLAELPEGESGTVELVTMPVETGPQTLEVESRAGQGLADQARRQILVEGLAAIMFELRDLVDPIEVGGETGYEIRVVNQGTKAATNVQVAVHLPPGMQIVSAEGETQYNTQGGVVVFDPLPQLAPKADTLYKLHVQGLHAGDQRVTVEVNTDDIAQPIRREESTRVFGDE